MTTATGALGVRRLPPAQLLTFAGLGLSGVTLVATLPRLFAHGGGAGRVLGNAGACMWTLALLLVALGAVRTLGPLSMVGALFAGFFGSTALSNLVGRPIVQRWGADSSFAVAFWAPVTEELIKLLPVGLFLLMAARSRVTRPAASDAVLFGASVGGGFVVYENALYARGVGGLSAHAPLSLLVPTLQSSAAGGSRLLVGGHLVYTALAALGLGVTVAYRRRSRLAWFAAPLALAVAVIEHASVNELSLVAQGAPRPGWLPLATAVTLGGYLSTALLVCGSLALVGHERRLGKRAGLGGPAGRSLWPSRAVLASRRTAYAAIQGPRTARP